MLSRAPGGAVARARRRPCAAPLLSVTATASAIGYSAVSTPPCPLTTSEPRAAHERVVGRAAGERVVAEPRPRAAPGCRPGSRCVERVAAGAAEDRLEAGGAVVLACGAVLEGAAASSVDGDGRAVIAVVDACPCPCSPSSVVLAEAAADHVVARAPVDRVERAVARERVGAGRCRSGPPCRSTASRLPAPPSSGPPSLPARPVVERHRHAAAATVVVGDRVGVRAAVDRVVVAGARRQRVVARAPVSASEPPSPASVSSRCRRSACRRRRCRSACRRRRRP